MVAHVLRLRLALLFGGLRGSRRELMRLVLVTIAMLVLAGAAIVGLLAVRGEALSSALIVVGGSVLLGAASLAPAMGGIEDQLDPRKFAVFGSSAGAVAWSTMLASVISIPIAILIALAVVVAGNAMAAGAPGAVAIIFTIAGVVTFLFMARTSMLLGTLWRAHRSREVTRTFVVVALILVVPVAIFLASLEWGHGVPPAFAQVADIASVTPFGAVWAVPFAVASGHPLTLWYILIAVATLVVCAYVWDVAVSAVMHTVDKPSSVRERAGMGWFSVFPRTAAGAIAARSMVYWFRDRRYVANLVVVPIAAIAASLPLLIAGVPLGVVLLLPVPIMALFFGWIPHNDVAYDSTAVWMHVVSGVRGIADRSGRLVPIIVVAVPILAIAIPLAIASYGRWAFAPALVGVSANLFLAGLGLSSISSVIAPYGVSRPGDSPFQQPQRAGSGVGSQALVLLGTIAASIPSIMLAFEALTGDIDKANTAMWVGLGLGALVFGLGLLIGAVLFDRRGMLLMEFAEAN
ncbi:hypothetical protein [Microbacterium sp. NC79]|uniref:hypothetical protein n=1 Tax=Microbacterium sp. NC79 TaxID=2851009 RepID=UPI001C2BD364|nr:hypothetical protein [Microbacterium sp. NC79]